MKKEKLNIENYEKLFFFKTKWKGQRDFVAALSNIEVKAEQTKTKRNATCLICKRNSGSAGNFRYKNWEWPRSYMHYVIEHNLKPSKEFYDFVMKETGGKIKKDNLTKKALAIQQILNSIPENKKGIFYGAVAQCIEDWCASDNPKVIIDVTNRRKKEK